MLLKFQDFSSSTFSWKTAGPWRLVYGSDKATRSMFSQSAQGAKKKTQYRELGVRPGTEGSKQCFLYSSQLFQTQKNALEDTHQML